jgi:hypothetical protein
VNITEEHRQQSSTKYLEVKFNSTLRGSYIMIKLVSFQGCKDSSTYTKSINIKYQINKRTKITRSSPYMQKRPLAKIQQHLMIETLKKLGKEVTYLNKVKATYNDPIASIILMGKNNFL